MHDDSSDTEDDSSKKRKKARSRSRDDSTDSDTDESTDDESKSDDSLSDSSKESKTDDKTSTNAGSSVESGDERLNSEKDRHNRKKSLDHMSTDSSDSASPPPPKLTPVRKRGRPPGSLNKPKNFIPHLHSVLQQRGKVGRPKGTIGRGRSFKRGLGRGLMGRGSTKTSSLLKNIGHSLSKSSSKSLVRGRGSLRGRGSSVLNKIKIKSGRSPGRPPKKSSSDLPTVGNNTHKPSSSPSKDINKSMKFFPHNKNDKSNSVNEHHKWDSVGSLHGVSILEHEPDSLDEYGDDDYVTDCYTNGDVGTGSESAVDPRNYWIPPSSSRTLMDKVCITDVTTKAGETITFREFSPNSGFLKSESS